MTDIKVLIGINIIQIRNYRWHAWQPDLYFSIRNSYNNCNICHKNNNNYEFSVHREVYHLRVSMDFAVDRHRGRFGISVGSALLRRRATRRQVGRQRGDRNRSDRVGRRDGSTVGRPLVDDPNEDRRYRRQRPRPTSVRVPIDRRR